MIPRAPKFLAAILLAPIFLALIARHSDSLDQFLRDNLGTHAGRLMVTYTTIIFCFMAGALWGFAARSTDGKFRPYVLSLLPAFYMLSAYSIGGGYRLLVLSIGFLLLLALDIYFKRLNLAPHWWLRFKLPFTAITVTCLIIFQFITFIHATLALS